MLALLKSDDFKLRLGVQSTSPVFTQYCYAPKSDIYLRKTWRSSWPKPVFDALQALSDFASAKSIDFAVGFSPEGLFDAWLNDKKQAEHD